MVRYDTLLIAFSPSAAAHVSPFVSKPRKYRLCIIIVAVEGERECIER